MTRDEILEYFKDINHAYNDCTRYDTLKRMLDELQEPCDDAISRQAVAEVLLKYAHSAEGKAFAEFLISQINDLPPVTPQYTEAEIQKMQDLEFAEIQKAYEIGKAENPNRWIPVSERLPELTINDSVAGKQYTEDVLVYDGADLRVGYFVRNDKLDFSYWVAYGEDVYEPIAWMPIEPYKASPTGAESEV